MNMHFIINANLQLWLVTIVVCCCHRARKCEVAELGEQVALLTEAVTAKDHVVIELTNKVSKHQPKLRVG